MKRSMLLPLVGMTTLVANAGDPVGGSPGSVKPVPRQDRDSRNACVLPAVPRDASIVLFGTYDADTLSSVAVGGQEEETNLIDVTIEPGRHPLYLVLTSYGSMVWRIKGDRNRVIAVVLSSEQGHPGVASGRSRIDTAQSQPKVIAEWLNAAPRPEGISASGAVGIDKRRVHIVEAGCVPYFGKATGPQADKAVQAIVRAAGREPDMVAASGSVASVSVPSGIMTRAVRAAVPSSGFDFETWQDAVRFWPGGFARVNPRGVVAVVPVEPYKVLPSLMGLAQLVGSGAVRRIGRNEFRVERPIPFMPPRMGGAHAVTLVFAKGVAVPPGDPLHSCIIREGQGTGLGAACAGRDSDAP